MLLPTLPPIQPYSRYAGRDLNAEPMTIEADRAAASLDETILLGLELELPAGPSRQQEKTSMAEPRFKSGPVFNKDSAFKDPDFAYALACGLQNPGDQEILGQLLTPELRIKTFQGLINVSFGTNFPDFIRVHVFFLYLCCICFRRLFNAFLS